MRAKRTPLPRAVRLWFAAAGASGFLFGLFADRRPLGDDLFAHPVFLYAACLAAGLIVLRLKAGRPVPELIPDRYLVLGCLLGLALFLAGNFAGVRWLAPLLAH